jgi:hypothetical protein
MYSSVSEPSFFRNHTPLEIDTPSGISPWLVAIGWGESTAHWLR